VLFFTKSSEARKGFPIHLSTGQLVKRWLWGANSIRIRNAILVLALAAHGLMERAATPHCAQIVCKVWFF
jgi:hypothetical protein